MKERQPDRGEWEELRPYREVKGTETDENRSNKQTDPGSVRGRRLEEPGERPLELRRRSTVAAGSVLLLLEGLMFVSR